MFGCLRRPFDVVRPLHLQPTSSTQNGRKRSWGALFDFCRWLCWWQVFQDPLLTRLIENAAAGNLDLHKAMLRIQETRALYGISQADDYPILDSTGLIQRRESSEETGTGNASGFFHAGFDAAWELDLFGKIRRSQQAALAEVETRQEAMSAVLISLQAEVALNYLELRTFQERLVAARGPGGPRAFRVPPVPTRPGRGAGRRDPGPDGRCGTPFPRRLRVCATLHAG